MSRYKLRGDVTWCLNLSNGWIRIHHVMFRWNTNHTPSYTYLSIGHMRKKTFKQIVR